MVRALLPYGTHAWTRLSGEAFECLSPGVLSPHGGSEEEWFVFIYVMQEFVLVGVMVAGLVMATTIMIVMFKLMIRKMVTSEIAEVIIIIVIGGNYFRN